jgi:hypothetical protein
MVQPVYYLLLSWLVAGFLFVDRQASYLAASEPIRGRVGLVPTLSRPRNLTHLDTPARVSECPNPL